MIPISVEMISRSPLVNPATGVVTREGYLFLFSLIQAIGGGSINTSLADVQLLEQMDSATSSATAEIIKGLADAYLTIALTADKGPQISELAKSISDLANQIALLNDGSAAAAILGRQVSDGATIAALLRESVPFGAVAARQIFTGPISGAAQAPSFKSMNAVQRKSTAQNQTSNIVLTNDADLLFAIGANEEWIGRAFIGFGAALVTTGVKVTIAGPAGATGNIMALLTNDSPTAQESDFLVTNTLGAALDFTTALVGNSSNGLMEVVWRVVNGSTPGNIAVQWAQSSSSVTALTAFAGSQMKSDRVV